MAEGPIRVSSGTFRVDRARMLAKLTRFQFPTRTAFLDGWLRAACASQATRIELESLPDGFSLRFDGKPFSRERLETVSDALFDPGGTDGRRCQYLALGLLGCLRLGPAEVTIDSGKGDSRVRFGARSLDEESLTGASGEEDDHTIIRVTGCRGINHSALTAHAENVCEVPTMVDGHPFHRALDPEWLAGPRATFNREGLRAVVARELHREEATVRVYVDGVLAKDFPVSDCPAVVWAHATSRALRLDPGKGNGIADSAFQEVLGVVRRSAVQLFDETLSGQRRRLRLAGKLMLKDRRLRDVWEEELASSKDTSDGLRWALGKARRGLAAMAGKRPEEEERADVAETARVTRWLRTASRLSLRGWQLNAAKPSDRLRPAWTAPLFLDWKARPLSLLELRTALENSGSLNWSAAPRSADSKATLEPVVWTVGASDLETLHAVFRGARAHDVTPLA